MKKKEFVADMGALQRLTNDGDSFVDFEDTDSETVYLVIDRVVLARKIVLCVSICPQFW